MVRPWRAAPRGLKVWVGLASLLGMMACMEGYPDEPIQPALHPFDMSMAQRLDAMNQVGATAQSAQRWAYAMRPGCVLRVDIDGPQGAMPSFDIPLLGVSASIAPDAARQRYDVEVKLRAPGVPARSFDVLQATEWHDASWMLLLFKVSQALCQPPKGAAKG